MEDRYYRALVVDDEAIARKMLTFALRKEGFSCDIAEDGNQASELIAGRGYDLVVTDLRMPNKHGHALVVDLVDMDQRPVIMVHTSVDHPGMTKDLLMRGVDDIVYKPTNYETFAAKARGLVLKRQSDRAAGAARSAPPCDAATEDSSKSGQHDESQNAPPDKMKSRDSDISKLLPLSQSALDAYNLTRSDNSNPDQIAAAIECDAALVADLLAVGNSAYYNPAGKKELDLADIVVRMGRKRIGELALRASVYGAMTKQKIPWLDVALAWKRSIAAGVAVDLLVSQGRHDDIQEGLFLSTIMHPLGRIVLAANHSEEHRALTEECRRNGEPLALAERRAFGKSHAQGMAELLEQWNIPSEVTVPLRHSLDSYSSLRTLQGDSQTRVELVKMAMLIGRVAVGHWDPADLVEFPPTDVVRRLGMRSLTDLIQQTHSNFTAIINSCAGSDIAESSERTVAVHRVGYCHLAGETFDFLAAMFRPLGIEPVYSGLQHEPRVLVNAWEAEPDRITAQYTAGDDQQLMIVANEGHQEEFQEHGRVLVLPNSYSRLRDLCRGSAKDAEPREACIA